MQQALKPVFPYVPEMIAYCDDPSVLGAEFYVMRRIDGLIPRRELPRGVPARPRLRRDALRDVVDRLVELHQVDAQQVGLGALGKGPGYPQAAGRRAGPSATRRRAPGTCRASPRVTDWLKANTPDDIGTCVIHNDFRFDNVVLDPHEPSRVIGVLDWELATLGDPLMDLGNSLAYWVQADDDFVARLTAAPADPPARHAHAARGGRSGTASAGA